MNWDLFVCDFNKPACESLGRKCTVKSYGLQNLVTSVTQSAALTKGCPTSLPGHGNASSSLIPLGLMPLAWMWHYKRLTVMPTQTEVSFSSRKFGSWATLALRRSLILQPRPPRGMVTLQSSSEGHQGRSFQARLLPWLSLLLCRFQWATLMPLVWGSMRTFEQLWFKTGHFHGQGMGELWINT